MEIYKQMDRNLTFKNTQNHFHLISVLFTGASATVWAVAATDYLIPLIWLGLMIVWVLAAEPVKIWKLAVRFFAFGSVLLAVSLFQIIFRRQGTEIFSINGFPLIYSDGLREAILLWIRYMILFLLAYNFSQISTFEFLVFLNKIRISTQFSLLLLTTVKFIPFILAEARKGFWSLRFRGICLAGLGLKNKFIAIGKILKPLLYRGIHYAAYSALALELRGYGNAGNKKIPVSYPLRLKDVLVVIVIAVMNFCCVRMMFF